MSAQHIMTSIILTTFLAVVVWASVSCTGADESIDNQVVPESLLGDLEDIRFLLWTRSNPGDRDYYRLLPEDLDNLNHSPLNTSLPTYIIYHGFNDNGESDWILNSKTEVLGQSSANVLSVDWQTLVPAPWYASAVHNVYRTANYSARLLDWLHAERGLQAARIHIIGHSLGAHTAGLTGRYLTSGTVARITGLDPAGPFFYHQPSDRRIDPSDAAFVDIVHTNSGSIIEGCNGLFEPVGHVDFYPNGGMHQPGCFATHDSDWSILFGECSHARATELWVESIAAFSANQKFTSWPCSDWDTFFTGNCTTCGEGCLDMGFHVEQGLTGSYFLRTNPVAPYALGDNQ